MNFRRRSCFALYTVFYNFARVHQTLRVMPAMEAGLTNRVWTFEDLANMIDATVEKKPTGKRGPYNKRAR
jgi:hypothetical protein